MFYTFVSDPRLPAAEWPGCLCLPDKTEWIFTAMEDSSTIYRVPVTSVSPVTSDTPVKNVQNITLWFKIIAWY